MDAIPESSTLIGVVILFVVALVQIIKFIWQIVDKLASRKIMSNPSNNNGTGCKEIIKSVELHNANMNQHVRRMRNDQKEHTKILAEIRDYSRDTARILEKISNGGSGKSLGG